MPKRSMVAIFGPELEFVLFVAAPPLSLLRGVRCTSMVTWVGDVVTARVVCWVS